MLEFKFNDVLSAVANVKTEVPIVRLSSRLHLGGHKSTFFGPSYDFFDIQEFDPERDPPNQIIELSGDDDVIYARKCIEQHEVRMVFLADLSSSLDAGADLSKRIMLLETMGFMGAAGSRHQDPVGLLGLTDKIVLNIPARCGLNNFYYLLHCAYDFLDKCEPGETRRTDFYTGLDAVRRMFDKPCFIPVISDFIGIEKVISSPLFRFISSRHELMFIFLDDPQEFKRNKGFGFMRVEDIETGKNTVVSRRKIKELDRTIRAERKSLRRELRRMGIDSVVLEYGRHLRRLRKFFLRRHKSLRS